jgi:hypothetical protein
MIRKRLMKVIMFIMKQIDELIYLNTFNVLIKCIAYCKIVIFEMYAFFFINSYVNVVNDI